jgi:hypothetical protein
MFRRIWRMYSISRTHALQPDRAELQHLGDVVAGGVDVGVAEHHQPPVLRAGDQPHGRLQGDRAGGLGADERPGDVEAVLGQQLGEVVARHPAGDVRVPGADQVGVAVADGAHAGVELAAATAGPHDRLQLAVAGRPDLQAHPVVGDHVERLDVVLGLAGHQGAHAAGVVADHPAEGAPGVGGRVWPVGQVVDLGRLAEPVEHDAWLHPGDAALRVQLDDLVHVLGEVQHDRGVAALAGQAGAAAAAQHRDAGLAAGGERGEDVVGVAWHHHPDGDLPVVGGVGGVQRPAAAVEPHLPAHVTSERGGQFLEPVRKPERDGDRRFRPDWSG